MTAHRSFVSRWLSAGVLALGAALALTAVPARAAGLNGLWTTGTGDYAVFLQDEVSGATFALQLPTNLSSLKVWLGQGTATGIDLHSLVDANDTLVADVSLSSMNGTTVIASLPQPFSASLTLAWVTTEYAGVWQRSTGPNDYMVFCVLNSGGVKLGVQIDLSVHDDKTYSYAVYTGSLNGNQYNGLSLAGTGAVSRLDFGDGSLTGSIVTAGRPPVSTPFTATQIVKLAQSAP
jgi:hypothetical protein